MTLSGRIAQLKAQNNMTTEELSIASGVPAGTINKILNEETKNPTGKTLGKLARALGCTVESLYLDESTFQYENILPIKRRRIPLLGNIAAGIPIFADEDLECYLSADEELKCDFALQVQGNSMINARIHDGDIVFVRKQPDVEDGEIAVVLIDEDATLKRVYHIPGGVQLVAENPRYKPMIFTQENCDTLLILGKAVAFQSKIR